MNTKSASERLRELEIEKQKILAEIERKKNLTPVARMSEHLHEKLCTKSHNDSDTWSMSSCGNYCDWNDSDSRARAKYATVALSVMEEFKMKFD